MTCHLLHILEQQNPRAYEDPDVKDIVGGLPQFFCTRCQPLRQLAPGEAIKCIQRESPCWTADPCA